MYRKRKRKTGRKQPFLFFFFSSSSHKDMFIDFRERGRDRETAGNIDVRNILVRNIDW